MEIKTKLLYSSLSNSLNWFWCVCRPTVNPKFGFQPIEFLSTKVKWSHDIFRVHFHKNYVFSRSLHRSNNTSSETPTVLYPCRKSLEKISERPYCSPGRENFMY